MTNEIPVSMFLFFLSVQFILLIYSLVIKRDGERIDYIITCALSGSLGYVNANMILNKNVNMLQSDGTAYSYIPIQSLPVHYFLLAVAVVSALLLIWFILDFFAMKLKKNVMGSALDGEL